MELPWNDPRSNNFITNVGLITSEGPNGQDIMACEWTNHISYNPGLVAISVGPSHATHENILTTREFGINLCAIDQSVASSISGGYSGRSYDKIEALKELGYKFYKAKKIGTLMLEDAALNLECKLVNQASFGDHTTFVGEVIESADNPEKKSLAYHDGKYWSLKELEKPSIEERARIKKVLEKYIKN